MHNIELKWTKKSYNKVAKQQIIIKNIRALIPSDNEEMNVFTKTNYLKILAMIHHLWHLVTFNNWSLRGSSFKQLELSKSLENTENGTQGFALLASVKSSSSNCLRAKPIVLKSLPAVVVLYFTAIEKDKLFLIKYRNFHSALENKTM